VSRLRRTKRQRRQKRKPRSSRTAGLKYIGKQKTSELGEPQLAFVDEATGKITLERDYRLRPPPGKWGKRSPNPQLKIGRPPFDGINETRCRVCGERIDQWRAHITWEDGTRLIRQAAENQGIDGGGYRTRGPVLYAMHVLKQQAWWNRHATGGCLDLWREFDGQVPFPKPVVWACFYGEPYDCELFYQLEALHSLGIYRPSDWPAPIRQKAHELAAQLHRPDDLDRVEKQPPAEPMEYPDWSDAEIMSAVAQLAAPDTSQQDPEAVIPF